ncbi:major facilitator superfamily domain-containing protein [Mycotypha africana]|uniref:major facilitator superfamily domain-containing protein n=1 Tax=Mycotypha africana TaxID=64632 RepID=UPI0023019938|nr:major facilitator superfamily domain-containing protein [Mycotypha africana]KAI8968325.1 major facilitator superfamily domain-containing protein [Mycotypha africana]
MWNIFKPKDKKKAYPPQHQNDSNEDILRVIKQYSQSPMDAIHKNSKLDQPKYPFLLRYRTSNLFVIFISTYNIISNIYHIISLSLITLYIIEHQIDTGPSNVETSPLSRQNINNVLSICILSGIIGGSLLTSWVARQTKQRRVPLLVASIAGMIAGSVYMVSVQYWMLLLAGFVQGASNAAIWLFSSACIADAWSQRQSTMMVGFINSISALGAAFGLIVGGEFFYHFDHKICFLSTIVTGCLSLLGLVLLIEKHMVPNEWLTSRQLEFMRKRNKRRRNATPIHSRVWDAYTEKGGVWGDHLSSATLQRAGSHRSLSSEKDMGTATAAAAQQTQNGIGIEKATDRRLFMWTCVELFTVIYNVFVTFVIMSGLKLVVIQNLLQTFMFRQDEMFPEVITGTFLLPYAVSSFMGGVLCIWFEAKIITLTMTIMCVPVFIWLGLPNNNFQCFVSAVALTAILLSVIITSSVAGMVQIVQQKRLTQQQRKAKKEQPSAQLIVGVFGAIIVAANVGLFVGSFVSELMDRLQGFWLCFSFAMLLATCVPAMICFIKSDVGHSRMELEEGKKHTSKIVNNIRPMSFDESVVSDEDDDQDTNSAVGTPRVSLSGGALRKDVLIHSLETSHKV